MAVPNRDKTNDIDVMCFSITLENSLLQDTLLNYLRACEGKEVEARQSKLGNSGKLKIINVMKRIRYQDSEKKASHQSHDGLHFVGLSMKKRRESEKTNKEKCRLQSAVETFANDENSVSTKINNLLLRYKVTQTQAEFSIPNLIVVPGLPILNDSQVFAVKNALRRDLTLIQGPSQTGKTLTTIAIVYYLAFERSGKVLVCAPTNKAVDQLALKIYDCGFRVVRLFEKDHEATDSQVSFLGLKHQAQEEELELRELEIMKEIYGELTPIDENRYRTFNRKSENELLKSADVVCCTCICAGDNRLSDCRFKNVLIDDSTQATESECMIPIELSSNKLILVGEHQLEPITESKESASVGLIDKSLFERLVLLGVQPIQFHVKY